MPQNYYYMSGAGNLFVVAEESNFPIESDYKQIAELLCNPKNLDSILLDGLIIICKSQQCDFEMKYFNRDGSTGMMCGNGGRCAVKFAFDKGYTTQDKTTFVNSQIEYSAIITERGVKVFFPEPKKFKLKFKLNLLGDMRICHFADVGTPHAVLFVDEINDLNQTLCLKDLDLNLWGKSVRNHTDFSPDGANANFVEISDLGIMLRTFERGVEAETGACGTGAISSAIISNFLRGVNKPVKVTVTSGAILYVDFDLIQGKISNLSLEGGADYFNKNNNNNK